MTAQALSGRLTLGLAALDDANHRIGDLSVRGFGGKRLAFAARNTVELLRGAHAIYDYAGTGRANLPGRSYAVWVHGAEFWTTERMRSDYARVIRRADCVLVNSNTSATAMLETIGPVSHAKVCWLGTSHDDAPEGPVPNGPPTVLVVGRADEFLAKGQDILVEEWPKVVASVREAKLCFIGDGVRLPDLRHMAARSPAAANIDVLGFQSDAYVELMMRKSTVLALLGRLEGFGLVAVEAMRHSLPVLASTNDATCEINIDGKTGFNVDRGDRAGIVDRIVTLLRDRDQARDMGSEAFAHWKEHFRFSRFRSRFLSAAGNWLGHVER